VLDGRSNYALKTAGQQETLEWVEGV